MKRGDMTWETCQEAERVLVEARSTVRWYQHILDSIPLWANDNQGVVLEIGAGPSGGFRTLVLCHAYHSVDPCWGDETSPWGDLRISAEALPMPDETYDLVIISNALDHCEHPKVVAGEIARVLKRGGVALTGHYLNQPDPHPWAFESAREIKKLFPRGMKQRYVATISSKDREGYTVVWLEKS